MHKYINYLVSVQSLIRPRAVTRLTMYTDEPEIILIYTLCVAYLPLSGSIHAKLALGRLPRSRPLGHYNYYTMMMVLTISMASWIVLANGSLVTGLILSSPTATTGTWYILVHKLSLQQQMNYTSQKLILTEGFVLLIRVLLL